MHESGCGVTQLTGETHALHGLGLVPHHQPAHDGVLEKTQLENGEEGIGIEVREIFDPHEGLISRMLGAL